jgi:hypothetical protein
MSKRGLAGRGRLVQAPAVRVPAWVAEALRRAAWAEGAPLGAFLRRLLEREARLVGGSPRIGPQAPGKGANLSPRPSRRGRGLGKPDRSF